MGPLDVISKRTDDTESERLGRLAQRQSIRFTRAPGAARHGEIGIQETRLYGAFGAILSGFTLLRLEVARDTEKLREVRVLVG